MHSQLLPLDSADWSRYVYKATVEFYTADTQTTYSVIIEGVTMEGKLIYSICHFGVF
ncbi:hypothetical protein AGMMS50262_23330 [Bacteroidia bacterium]|nr:hypothetical protein AGMMS50262_23330 [Bacteroidia bacterium]